MTDLPFLPYAQSDISSDDIEAVKEALTAPIITRGLNVEAFEQAIADDCGASYAVAFNSGTTALMAAYAAAEVNAGDVVLTTPNSFVATIGPAIQYGATPIFIDIDRVTGNLDFTQLLLNMNQRNSRGKTVITPVHFSGIPFDVQAVQQRLNNPDTLIIEDAAHALGSRYKDGSKVGSCMWSDMTIFSFHPAKTITTGEGGMVTTNDAELCRKLRLFRNNGIERDPTYLQNPAAPWYYEVVSLSGNYNFTEFQAALGLSQLKRLDFFVKQRQLLIHTYQSLLSEIDHLRLLTPPDGVEVASHLCVVQIDFAAYQTDRTTVMEKLKDKGIGTQLHYVPIYRHPFFTAKAGDISEYFPEMEKYYAQALSLPLFSKMESSDVERVVDALKEILVAVGK